ncbi:MAG TPA: hypothetical protein VGP18_03615 [Solirubrobacteraceae bacterium]|nr:hypothetical protein [Solirubrobacteraceae bacterium]
MHRLRQERGGIVGIRAERLGDGDHVDPKLGAQELLVALGLDGVAREAAGVEHEYDVEAALHPVLDQALEAGALVGFAAGLEVEVLLGELHTVVGRIASDRLALPVG